MSPTPMTATAAGPPPGRMQDGISTVTSRGTRLLQQLQRELPGLSPKLGNVARFCIEHAATLHHYRIHEVATACGTIPASVVRLAQRFGLSGFQDLKYALVDRQAREVEAEPEPRAPWLYPECVAAQQHVVHAALGLAGLKGLVSRPDFRDAVQGLRAARQLHFDWAGEEDRLIASHLQARLRERVLPPVARPSDRRDPEPAGAPARDVVLDGPWLVRVSVWHDLAPSACAIEPAAFGPRVLRLTRGRMNRGTLRDHDGIVMHVGTDARRMLNALALCEAIASAAQPGAERRG